MDDISALDLGMLVSLVGESVFSRCLSSLKYEKTRTCWSSKIISYTQGELKATLISLLLLNYYLPAIIGINDFQNLLSPDFILLR